MKKAMLLLAVAASAAASPSHPLGVPQDKLALYENRGGKFECLDRSLKIDFAALNDNFCDCPDGSDEPGTSACPQGHFVCENKGYFPQQLPSSRVGDGICDCCDGSDEPRSQACPNDCDEKGRESREKAREVYEKQKAGWDIRKARIQEAVGLKKERDLKIVHLRDVIKRLEEDIVILNEAREKAEQEEKSAIENKRKKERKALKGEVKQFCNDFGHKLEDLTKEAGSARSLLVQLRDEPQGPDRDLLVDEAISQLDKMLAKIPTPPQFCTNEQTKDSIQTSKQTECVTDESRSKDPAGDEDHDYESFDDEFDFEQEAAGDLAEDFEEENHKAKDEVDEKVALAMQAREKSNAKEGELKTMKNELHALEQLNELDLGPNSEFALIHGKCYELVTKEYTYDFCPYKSCTQKPLKGGSNTGLGSFSAWEPHHGSPHGSMKFTNGIKCWGGPNRSSHVIFECGAQEELLSVDEPSKCEYVMRFSTPLACSPPETPDEILANMRARLSHRDEL